MECLDYVKNASFFTFFKTKSEFVFFGKDFEKKNSDFVLKNVKIVKILAFLQNLGIPSICFKNIEKTRKND
jgi:hypothetical protein